MGIHLPLYTGGVRTNLFIWLYASACGYPFLIIDRYVEIKSGIVETALACDSHVIVTNVVAMR